MDTLKREMAAARVWVSRVAPSTSSPIGFRPSPRSGVPNVDSKVAQELRERLISEHHVYPEHVEVESSRVMDAAFKH